MVKGPLQIKFVKSATDVRDLPDSPAEVAFVGRSNGGKSSLINALANQRQLHFTHLPQECTIRIFNVAGQLVQTLNVSNSFNTSRFIWDMRDKNGREIPYGVYIFHVEAPGIGEKVGKFAVIK